MPDPLTTPSTSLLAVETLRRKIEAPGEVSISDALAALDALVAERDEALRALRAISENANSYHGDADAKQRALNVIGCWATWPDSIPDGVGAEAV